MDPTDDNIQQTPLQFLQGLTDEEHRVRTLRRAVDRSLAVIRRGRVDRTQADMLCEDCRKLAIELFGSEAAAKFDLIYAPRFSRAARESAAGPDEVS
jgi:hypothetical protein